MATATTADVLRKALEILDDGKSWTKGNYAKSKYGYSAVLALTAVSFCAIGGVRRAAHELGWAENDAYRAFDALARNIHTLPNAYGSTKVVGYNDAKWRKWSEVKALFNRAIKDVEKRES